MQTEERSIAEIASYHAHIYYDSAARRHHAARIRDRIAARFPVRLGRWRDTAVGPHTAPMFLVAFETALFPAIVPWLMLNHRGLSILVHPNTTHPRRDHVEDALWIGARLPVLEERLQVSQDVPDGVGELNTRPLVAQAGE